MNSIQQRNEENPASSHAESDVKTGFTGLQVTLITIAAVLATLLVGWWVLTRYIFPADLEPVELSSSEQTELDRKLAFIGIDRRSGIDADANDGRGAMPEPYTEEGASRVVEFSERELNGLIASDPQWGSRLAIDLADDLASITALVPVPPDFPVMPGKTVRVNAGAELAYRDGRPVVMLKGVSLMGVPVPNAWLGNIKNVDLVSEFGSETGFWKSFADGVEEIQITDGQLRLQLRE